ncbi:hypothetical protein GJ496_012071 [Pomphorhynchus laevis]|nr:hypothetical protein GJ496_012071 [Pomphorhynchus laevis]
MSLIRISKSVRSLNSIIRFTRFSRQQPLFYRTLSEIAERTDETESPKQLAQPLQKVKASANTAFHGGVIMLAIGFTGAMMYLLFKELFTPNTMYRMYNEASDMCIKNNELREIIGKHMRVFGIGRGRGGGKHPRYATFSKDGQTFMLMQFNVDGSLNAGTVETLALIGDNDKYELQRIVVELQKSPHIGRRIIVL